MVHEEAWSEVGKAFVPGTDILQLQTLVILSVQDVRG